MHEHSEQSVNIELDMSARAHLASIVDFDNERKLRARERCEFGTCKRTGCAYCAAIVSSYTAIGEQRTVGIASLNRIAGRSHTR